MYNDDYNLYKLFVSLYEEKSISRTAENLFVSQPAISYSLKELEKNLGYKLFYRTPKGIEPTSEADELYKYIVSSFNLIDEGKMRIKEINKLIDGVIKIGTPSHVGIFFVTEIIKKFRKKYPKIKIEIYSRSTDRLVELLETRKLDIIIDMLPIKIQDKNAKKEVISEANFCFAYSKKYFKNIKIKTPKDLLKYPLILQETNSSYQRNIIEYMQLKGVNLVSSISSWSSEMTMQLVREGLGIGYFLKNMLDVQPDKADYEVITFDDTLPKISVCAVYKEEVLSPSEKEFIKIIKENMKS